MCGGSADGDGAEVVEVFEVGFVEGVADDFDVEVVEVRGGEAVAEVGGCVGGMRCERCDVARDKKKRRG